MVKTDTTTLAVLAGLAALWAGVSLAGNLIAAPAKFQVAALEMPVALQVGRAQFLWVGYAEWALFGLATLVPIVRLTAPPMWLAVPLIIFALQQMWLQPLLRLRSDQIIAGHSLEPSLLHVYFAGLEGVKCLCLIGISAMSLVALVREIN